MRRWFDPGWYRFLWRRIGPDGRLLVGILAAAAVAVGGFFSVRAFASSGEPSSAGYVRLTTTITKVVHVSGDGRTVVRRIPVVRRIFAKPVTLERTTTVPGESGTRVVTQPVVRYRPVYRRQVVTIHGKAATVKQVVTDVQRLTDTRLTTVTNERTVVQAQTVTVVRMQTSPPETVLVHQPPATVTVTVTMPFVTITVPTYTIP